MASKREKVIEVKDLKKSYGQVIACEGVSFHVERGEVFTLLGPNGAGKTTIVEILEGLKQADSGELIILGQKCKVVGQEIKEKIGVLLQENHFMDRLKVREMISLFASFFKTTLSVKKILSLTALESKENAFVENLSGGQRQRLAIGLALINDPEILFLDEPSTGLDPQSRRNVWDLIAQLRDQKKTIFLTTHYMEEAENLSDYVYIMDHGRIIAEGTPSSLITELGGENVVEFKRGSLADDLIAEAAQFFLEYKEKNGLISLYTANLAVSVGQLLEWARQKNLSFDDIIFRRPNLEDVFLSLTGKGLRD